MGQVASQASQVQTLTEECASGVEQACASLSREEEAKNAWLASLDQEPAWKRGVGAGVSEEEQAKRAWLARLEE